MTVIRFIHNISMFPKISDSRTHFHVKQHSSFFNTHVSAVKYQKQR